MIVLKTIIAIIRLLVVLIILVPSFYIYKLAGLFCFKITPETGFAFRRYACAYINFVFGVVERVEGRPSLQPALYVCNHRGLTDFIINLRYLDAYILSKAQVEKIPVLGHLANQTGIFYVKRRNRSSIMATREAIIEKLDAGYNVILYPEGTTNSKPGTIAFHSGAFEEVAKHNYRVVPMALEYKSKSDLWKSTSMKRQFINQFGKPFTYAKMAFGEPIESDDPKYIKEEARKWIDVKLAKMQKNWSKAY